MSIINIHLIIAIICFVASYMSLVTLYDMHYNDAADFDDRIEKIRKFVDDTEDDGDRDVLDTIVYLVNYPWLSYNKAIMLANILFCIIPIINILIAATFIFTIIVFKYIDKLSDVSED